MGVGVFSLVQKIDGTQMKAKPPEYVYITYTSLKIDRKCTVLKKSLIWSTC